MSEKPRELELIDNFYNFVDRISEALNTLLIDQLGEDANWDDHVGISELPYKFLTAFKPRSETQKLFAELWELREESNGLCASLDDYKPHEWAKEQYEAAQQIQETEKPLNAYDRRVAAQYLSTLYPKPDNIPYTPEEGKTWETDANVQRHWSTHYAEHYSLQVELNDKLRSENKTLVTQNLELAKQSLDAQERYDQAKTMMKEAANSLRITQSDYANYKKSSEQEFRCLKAEIITSLRAIDLCILASLCTEKQWLTHRARNFRMRHVHQIITNEVDRFGDRKLTNYEDDF